MIRSVNSVEQRSAATWTHYHGPVRPWTSGAAWAGSCGLGPCRCFASRRSKKQAPVAGRVTNGVTIATDGSGHRRTCVDNSSQVATMIRKQERVTAFPDTEEIICGASPQLITSSGRAEYHAGHVGVRSHVAQRKLGSWI